MTALNKSAAKHLPADVRVRVKSTGRHNINNDGDPAPCSFRERFIRLRSASIEDLKAGAAAAFGLSLATEGNDSSHSSTSSSSTSNSSTSSSSTSNSSTNMSLSYLHPSGGKAFLNNDDDVMLALKYWRSCPVLTVSASWSGATQCKSASPDKVEKLYHEAAENLRDCHGVASITPASLKQAVTLLNVPPRRLVAQGLAPRWKGQHQQPAAAAPTDVDEFQDINAAGGRGEITPEMVDDDTDLMSDYEYFSDDEDDELEGEEDDDSTASAASTSEAILAHDHGMTNTASISAEIDAMTVVTSAFIPLDDNQQRRESRNNVINVASTTTQAEQDAAAVTGDEASSGLHAPVAHAASDKDTHKTPIHDALLAGGVNVSPQETGALLHALGVDPERLVLLGLMRRELLTPTGTAAPRFKTHGPLGRPTPRHRTVRVSVRLAGSKRGPQSRGGGGGTKNSKVGSRALVGSASCSQLAVAPLLDMNVRKRRSFVVHGSGYAQSRREGCIGGPTSRSFLKVRTCSGRGVRAAFHRRLSSTSLA